jgi:hypothetical protein
LEFCDALDWAGSTDWRLPDRFELQSIVDRGRSSPAIDTSAFPRMYSRVFWSSSSCAGDDHCAWYVHFDRGDASGLDKEEANWIRCVRRAPGARAEEARLSRTEPVVGEPVVTDGVTGLLWQGCAAGQSGSICSATASTHTWQESLAYCERLDWGGRTDWHLPDIEELASIVDDRRPSPAIDVAAFPETPPGGTFWSSSSYAGEPSMAWAVAFGSGAVRYDGDKGHGYNVRCACREP